MGCRAGASESDSGVKQVLGLSTRSSAPNVEQLAKPHIPLGNNATVDNRGQVMGECGVTQSKNSLAVATSIAASHHAGVPVLLNQFGG
jgi:hypothetical protein